MGAVDEVLDLEDIGFDPTFPEAIMLIATTLLAHAWGRNLVETYRRIYGDQEPQIAAALDEAARLVIERFASSDVRCIMIANTPRWLRFASRIFCAAVASSGCHCERLGTYHFRRFGPRHRYVRWICPGDTAEHFVTDVACNTVTPPRGASGEHVQAHLGANIGQSSRSEVSPPHPVLNRPKTCSTTLRRSRIASDLSLYGIRSTELT
jgi:hypothetical protein